jgi:hypothetical protein
MHVFSTSEFAFDGGGGLCLAKQNEENISKGRNDGWEGGSVWE